MASTTIFLLLLCSPTLSYALDQSTKPSRDLWLRSSSRKVPAAGFYDPAANGGSTLTQIPVTFPMGQGEPTNMIISGNSDAAVLVDQATNGGLRTYFLSLGFSGECLGQRDSSNQAVNLGDGNGYKNETATIRWNYGDPNFGTCKETLQGGNHFRYWIQDGPEANSGAVFMAVSYELPIAQQHDIIANGYNLGRDYLIGNITKSVVPTTALNDLVNLSGSTSAGGYTYQSNITYVSGLLPNTSYGINHNQSVSVGGMLNAVDGLVAVLDVKITAHPAGSAGWRPTPSPLWGLPPFVVLIGVSLWPFLAIA